MAKNAKHASVQQIILISYLIIMVPATLLAYHTIQIIDDELANHINFVVTGTIDAQPRTTERLVQFGDYLRENSFPFSKTNMVSVHDKTSPLYSWTNKLHSERVAILYSWAALISFSLIVCLGLVGSLQKVFRRLIAAIDNLIEHKLSEEIDIESRFVLPDVSESLETLRLQMSNDEQQQQQFLRHISHEIKTPLTSIKEGSILLDQQVMGAMNSEQKEVTSILVRSSIQLQSAIENLLDYNAAIGLQQDTPRSRIDLTVLIQSTLKNNELSIKQKDLQITLSLKKCEALVDRRQMTAVFDNLLSNAIKNSPFGEKITITLSKKSSNKCCFRIADNGPGIDPVDREYIFDPFYIGAQRSEATLKGSGLGLSIAKQYVDDHQGQIVLLESEIGATFNVLIPIE